MSERGWPRKVLQAPMLSLGKNRLPELPVLPERIADASRRSFGPEPIAVNVHTGQHVMGLVAESVIHNPDHGFAGGIPVTNLNAKLAGVGGKT